MSSSRIKNPRKIFSSVGDTSLLASEIAILNNNVYKVTYYEIITGASGTLTVPATATINAGEFSGANCVLSEIDGANKPTYITPLTGGGVPVTSTLNTLTGAWVKSGVTASVNVALIYSINITAQYYQNLNNFYIIDSTLVQLYNSSNGITEVLNDFQLGGALTQNTSISGASTYSLDLGTNISRLSTFVVRSNSSNTLFFTDGVQSSLIFQNSGSTLINHSTGTNFSRLSFNGQAVIVNSDFPSFPGIQEASDYSANYTALSLINKGYVVSTYRPLVPRVVSMANATSFTPTGDTADINTQANTQALGNLTANAPSGTPVNGQLLEIVISSTNIQTFVWNAIYAGCITNALPVTTSGSTKTDKFFFQYNSAVSKWQIINAQYGYT